MNLIKFTAGIGPIYIVVSRIAAVQQSERFPALTAVVLDTGETIYVRDSLDEATEALLDAPE